MSDSIEVKWYVDDGYISDDRPQTASIDPSYFEGLDREAAEEALDEIIQDYFTQNVSWYCKNRDEIINAIMTAAKNDDE